MCRKTQPRPRCRRSQHLGARLQGRWPCSHVDGSCPGRFLYVFSSNWLGLCLFASFKISPQKLLPLRFLFLKIRQCLLGHVFVTDGQQLVVKGGAMSSRLIYPREGVSASAFDVEHNGSQKLRIVNRQWCDLSVWNGRVLGSMKTVTAQCLFVCMSNKTTIENMKFKD